MFLSEIVFKDHPALGDFRLDLRNKDGEPYKIILLAGENGCGKTTLLKEICFYESSEFIVGKEVKNSIYGTDNFESVYVRQDHKYSAALDEISKKICSQNIFEKPKKKQTGGQNVASLRSNVNANSSRYIENKIAEFANNRLNEIAKDNFFGIAKMYDQASSLVKIDTLHEEDKYIDLFSSGEQEILIMLNEIRQKLTINTDFVLLDEPETSLHPKWQLKILDFIKESLRGIDGELNVQIFIATHSENILRQAIEDKDILIIRMYRENGLIQSKRVSDMDLRVRRPTFTELQYIIFDIPSSDYHNLLISEIMERNSLETIKKLDEFIIKHGKYDESVHKRESKGKGKVTYETLPVYIRNKYHHPEMEDIDFTENQLKTSIELLRNILD